jgi:hypothetical protein
MLRNVLALGLMAVAAAWAEPSDSTAAKPDSSWRDLAPRLYVQDETWSDIDFIKTEITFANYVRDRNEADVQLMITCQTTGDGGQEYCLTFAGLGSFHDINAVLKHTVPPDATPDDTRKALVDAIRRGLVPYVARTKLRDNLRVEFTPPTAKQAVTDNWRNWVFSLSLNGWANADNGYSYMYYYAYPSIKRITETEQLTVTGGVATTRHWYALDSSDITTLSRSYDGEADYGRKLSSHLAVGARLLYNTSDYSNIRWSFALGPRFEYDIVPYSEYVRHKIYLQVIPVAVYNSYFDTTLYNQTREYLTKDEVLLGANLTRSWGTLTLTACGGHYLPGFARNRLSLYSSLSVRVVAGLSVSLYGGYDLIHDQVALRKAGATEEERLLRLREMETSYYYWASVGITYTFGSAFANIVNPIF